MEYMTAEYIWETLKEKFTEKTMKGKYIIGDNNEHEAFKAIFDMFSKQSIRQRGEEIKKYLEEIIQEDTNTEVREEVGKRLYHFLPYMMERDFLLAYDSEKTTNPIKIGERVFYGCWTVFSYAQAGKKVFSKETKEKLAYLLRTFEIRRLNFSGIDLSGENLISILLPGINLSGANLQNAHLLMIIGQTINLSDADLSKASLINADLFVANLTSANLSGANLRRADLSGANLTNTNLTDAILEGANLSDAIISTENHAYAKAQGAIVDEEPRLPEDYDTENEETSAGG
jgi:hypothetical protein